MLSVYGDILSELTAADQTQVSGSAWFPLSFPNYFFISVFLVEESSDTAPGSLILQAFFSLRLKVLQKWINSDHTI